MYTVTQFPQGTFSWADLISTDQAAAREFYAKLMDWQTDDAPMSHDQTYTFFTVDGHRVAAVGPMPQEMRDQGMPSVWANYIAVDDVDAMVDKVTEAGGTVVTAPFDILEDGRMMTLQDPTGATVSLWQAKNSIGAGMVNGPGAMVWNELNTRDPQVAQDFYGKVFGWTFEKDPDMDYYYISNNGRYNGGIFLMTEDMAGMPPAWTVTFHVRDIDSTVDKAKQLGGTIVAEIMSAPDVGRFAVIADPTGGVFTVLAADKADPWLEHTS